MGKKKPKSLGVWPAVKPFANGGASGMLATCVIQPIDMIKFDVTFPALPCSILSLDAMDISGEQHLDVKHDIVKKRLDTHGNVIEERQDGIGAPKIEKPLQKHGGRLEHNETYCGSCYGAEVSDDDCCNSCDEVRELYRKKGWALSNPDSIDQELLRMVMSSVGLEGAGDVGQRIRDEILVI